MKAIKILMIVLLPLSLFAAKTLIKPIPESIEVDAAKVQLGKKLFSDPILSRDGTISCATCHDLQNGGDDGSKFAFGISGKKGAINSPTVYNSGYNFRQFWDGRARDLKEQARGPIENPVEMGHTMEGAVQVLQKSESYSEQFEAVYSDGITQENLVDAIAEFEKALITPNAPFDRYIKGDKEAIDPEVKRGYQLFVSKGCILCHHGINVGGNMYNKFGVFEDANSSNLGRYNVTKREEDKYFFKVPSLRNVEQTAPYMHDGRVAKLRQAVLLMSQYQLGREIKAEDIDAIVLFLQSLTGVIPEIVK